MPIRFSQLLQESWNFLRNHTQFTLLGSGLLLIIQLANGWCLSQVPIDLQHLQHPSELTNVMMLKIMPMVLLVVLGIFVNVLLILNIKSISQGNYRYFFQQTKLALKFVFPVFLLTVIIQMPIAIVIGAILSGTGNILFFLLIIFALFILVKFCLANFVYLLEVPQKRIFESLGFIWRLTEGKTNILLIFCLLTYVVPALISMLVINVMGSEIGEMVSYLLSAVMSLYFTVFGFRFYQVIRQLDQ